MQKRLVESLDGRFDDECLNEHKLGNLPAARRLIEDSMADHAIRYAENPGKSSGAFVSNELCNHSTKERTIRRWRSRLGKTIRCPT